MSDSQQVHDAPRVVIAGGGIAGLEAALALHHLAPGRARVSLVAPDPDFLYKPMAVEEPFSLRPPERLQLAPLLDQLGMAYLPGAVTAVAPDGHEVVLADGSAIGYEMLVVAVGARARPAFTGIETFWAFRSDVPIDALMDQATAHRSRTIAFVVPPGTTWTLPLYELALMTRRRAERRGLFGLAVQVVTPEASPMGVFGAAASGAVQALLMRRGIEVVTEAYVTEEPGGGLRVRPGDGLLDCGAAIALPALEGPAIAGLPTDEHGFTPIDEHARVPAVPDVYAAGDGTTFPVKQGGLATQQADAAAEHIAHRLGAAVEPHEFHPVLRGKLLTGDESVDLRHDVTGGHGDGAASLDYLWWPPQKVSGRFLAAWLAGTTPQDDLEPPYRPLEVEVSLPREWHADPIAAGRQPMPTR